MKLLFVLSLTLALSLAEEIETNLQAVEDLQTSASVISPRSQDYNLPIANYYNNVPNSVAPKLWNPPSNYDSVKPAVLSASVRNYYAPKSNYNQPESGYNNQYNQNNQNSWSNPQQSQPSNAWSQNNGWNNQQQPQNNVWNNQQKPQNNGWNNQQNAWNQQNSWNQQGSSQNAGAQNNWNKPQSGGSQNSWNKPQNSGSQNNWNAGNNQNNWNAGNNQNVPSSSSTTTPVPVIKNEQILGDNGSYKYEYEIADGTHVSEEGYATNVNTQDESIVKKGFYSFTAADGKVYTVTYWADDSGFHAEGDHLPKPHPISPAIQASIDQNAKEEVAKAEEEKKKQQQQQQQQQNIYYPQGQEPPKPLAPQQPIQPTSQPVYPQQVYYPPQQTYYPPQNNYYPPQSYGK